MSTYIEEHLHELVQYYAAQDKCTPEEWCDRAILSVVRSRYCLEQEIGTWNESY